MKRPALSANLACTATLLALALTPVHAQTTVESNHSDERFDKPPSTRQSTAPTLQVYSRETVVDVLVHDDKGNPIHGLKQSDFAIQEDGKPQTIRSFFETRKDTPLAANASVPPPQLPPHTYTNRQPPPATGSSNIILLDSLNVDPSDQMRAHQYAAKYFKAMPPGTQVVLFGLGNGLKLIQGFTSNPEVLIAAMDDKKNSLLPPASKLAPCNAPKFTLDALRYIAAFVAGIKGRKNLLWFATDRFPLYDLCDPDLAREAFDMLASAQVAVDPIDVRGLFNPGASDVSDSLSQISAHTGSAVAAATRASYIAVAKQHLTMESIAERTGGVAFYNTNALDTSIGTAIETGANYYTLSYVPPIQAYDGRHHTIHVTVNRPHLELVYRTGYGADDPREAKDNTSIPTKLSSTTPDPADNTIVASMARFAPPSTQIVFDVKVLPSVGGPLPTDPPVTGVPATRFRDKPLVRYDILFTVPSDQITFADTPGDTHSTSIEFDAVAYDVSGSLLTSRSQSMPLPLTAAEYRQFLTTPFQFYEQLDLPPGQTFLRVGILDRTSNRIGTIEVPVTVGKAEK